MLKPSLTAENLYDERLLQECLVPSQHGTPSVLVSRPHWDRVICRLRRRRSLLADCLHYLEHPSEDLIRRGRLAARIREAIRE